MRGITQQLIAKFRNSTNEKTSFRVFKIALLVQALGIIFGCSPDTHVRDPKVQFAPVVPRFQPPQPQVEPTPSVVPGCRYKKALNYNLNANLEDGSCDFAYCNNETYDEYNAAYVVETIQPYLDQLQKLKIEHSGAIDTELCQKITGCMDEKADNFYAMANTESGKCQFKGCFLIEKDNSIKAAFNEYQKVYPDTIHIDTCAGYRGCTEELAENKEEGKLLDNGSCLFKYCPELKDQVEIHGKKHIAYQTYKQNFPQAASITNTCNGFRGCLEPMADNTSDLSQKLLPDGSCVFKGCPQLKQGLQSAFDGYIAKFPNAAALQNTCDDHKGCTTVGAINKSTEPQIQIDDGSCIFRGCRLVDTDFDALISQYLNQHGQLAEADIVQDTCSDFRACQEPEAINTNDSNLHPEKILESGDCHFAWCEQTGFQNTDSQKRLAVDAYLAKVAQDPLISFSGSINSNSECGPKLGCMESEASNFDSEASLDLGTCKFVGCPELNEDLANQFAAYQLRFPNNNLQNNCPNPIVETFNQNTMPHVGILWVIDNSGSMGNEQANLANNFNSFIQDFMNRNAPFTMAIATTDFRSIAQAPLELNSQKMIENPTRFQQQFETLIRIGTGGNNNEKAYDSAESVLTREANSFLKSNSVLAVIYLSDEREQSGMTVETHLANLRTHVAVDSKVQVHSIVAPTSDTNQRFANASSATGGIYADINTNFATSLNTIATDILDLLELFTLKSLPEPDTIKVKVNGVISQDWQYDPVRNAIDFSVPPGAGSSVTVRYLPKP